MTLDAAMTVTKAGSRQAGSQAAACRSHHKLVPVSMHTHQSSGTLAAAAAKFAPKLQQHTRHQLQLHAKAAAATIYKGSNSSTCSGKTPASAAACKGSSSMQRHQQQQSARHQPMQWPHYMQRHHHSSVQRQQQHTKTMQQQNAEASP